MIAHIIQTIIPYSSIKKRLYLIIIIKPFPFVPKFHKPFLDNIS